MGQSPDNITGRVVSVFGANDPKEGERAYDTAFAVGRVLGELGYAIANGGYGGTMEASAAGAKSAGGSTIGVTCSVWSSQPNEYVDEIIVTDKLADRLGKLIELGTGGYVVLPGATGTLAELAWVWELACKGFLPFDETQDRHGGGAQDKPGDGARPFDGAQGRPIVCVGEFWRPLVEMMAVARPASSACIVLVNTPEKIAEHFACL